MKISKGFSLVELLVAVTVVAVLAAIAYGQLERSWAKARDAERIEATEEIALAVELWYQENGRDPSCSGGIKIENVDIAAMSDEQIITDLVLGGGDLTNPTHIANDTCAEAREFYAFLRGVMGELPTDPLGPGNGDYFYYYDGGHNCDYIGSNPSIMDGATMVFAANLETYDSNVLEVCSSQSGNDGGFVETASHSGTKNPSQPYIQIVKRVING